jgi:DNA-binding NtrC family response regulator
MIVDDDEPIRAVVAELFESFALEAVSADGAEAALRQVAARDTAPLLVLVDVMMPGIDGLSLARKFRSRFKKQTKIVIISGHLNDASWWPIDLRELSFLPKPFRFADVQQLVEQARVERESLV